MCQHSLKCNGSAADIDQSYDAKWKAAHNSRVSINCMEDRVHGLQWHALQHFNHQMSCMGRAASGVVCMAQTPICIDGANSPMVHIKGGGHDCSFLKLCGNR